MKLTRFQSIMLEVIRENGGSVHRVHYPFGSYWVGANRVVLFTPDWWPGRNDPKLRLSTLNALVARGKLAFDRQANSYYLTALPASRELTERTTKNWYMGIKD